MLPLFRIVLPQLTTRKCQACRVARSSKALPPPADSKDIQMRWGLLLLTLPLWGQSVESIQRQMQSIEATFASRLKTCEEEDERACLTVQDAGVGFEPQGAERLFDAFYTTKSGGMGIGLSVSRSIIENHGGKLTAEANDGPGATFSFSIPRQATNAGDEGTLSATFTRPTRGAQDLTRNTE